MSNTAPNENLICAECTRAISVRNTCAGSIWHVWCKHLEEIGSDPYFIVGTFDEPPFGCFYYVKGMTLEEVEIRRHDAAP
jgi:hypothetical protein